MQQSLTIRESQWLHLVGRRKSGTALSTPLRPSSSTSETSRPASRKWCLHPKWTHILVRKWGYGRRKAKPIFRAMDEPWKKSNIIKKIRKQKIINSNVQVYSLLDGRCTKSWTSRMNESFYFRVIKNWLNMAIGINIYSFLQISKIRLVDIRNKSNN